MADQSASAAFATAQAGQAYDLLYKLLLDKNLPPVHAQRHAAAAAKDHTTAPGVAAQAIGGMLGMFASIAALVVDKVTEAKQAGQFGIHDLIAALLGDALLIDISSADIPIVTGSQGQGPVNAALGKKFVDAIKGFVGADGQITGDTAEQGAAALLGLAMQMSTNTGILAVLGGCLPQLHIDELKELGEMLEKSLGIGRMTRGATRPIIAETITTPLQRKYRAQFRQQILGLGELAKAVLADRMAGDTATALLQQHGLSDDQIAELLAQHTPRLSEADEELLTATGAAPGDDNAFAGRNDGASDAVEKARLAVLTYKRLTGLRNRVLSAVVSQINNGFLQPADLEKWLSSLNVPADEQTLWRQLAGVEGERTRKRLSEGDMLFLFEAAQITDQDVVAWAAAEGYSEQDQGRVQLLFALKAAASSNSKTGGSAAKAAHAHIEHVAYVTDEITGIFGRAPSAAELDFWVNLLDLGERTKADFKAELKALPADGTAIPPTPPA